MISFLRCVHNSINLIKPFDQPNIYSFTKEQSHLYTSANLLNKEKWVSTVGAHVKGLPAERISQLLTNHPFHYELKPQALGHSLLFPNFWLSNKISIIPSGRVLVNIYFWPLFLLFFIQMRCLYFFSLNLPEPQGSKILIHLLLEKVAYTCPLTRASICYQPAISFKVCILYGFYKK